MKRYYTSESVTEGHPDKVCDQISDAILDAYLSKDPYARVACETCACSDMILIMGEITSTAVVDVEKIAREKVAYIGYDDENARFNQNVKVVVALDKQSPDIAMGVDKACESSDTADRYDTIGAGDQGMMFGYATDETEELIPLALDYSHKLCRRLAEVRRSGILPYIRPDGKAQVTVEYDDGVLKRIDAIVISTQHLDGISTEKLREDVRKYVIDEVIDGKYLDKDTKIYINPTGRFVIGGPEGDTGLTGRKLIVDTYGGYAPHGGGSFSGKDATKVDRSAAYYARYVCKNIVAAGLAKRCQLDIAYAIGRARPVSVNVNTFGTGKVDDTKLTEVVEKVFDFRPLAIIEKLGLRNPVFSETASYGHFGRTGFSWEKTDMTEILTELIG